MPDQMQNVVQAARRLVREQAPASAPTGFADRLMDLKAALAKLDESSDPITDPDLSVWSWSS